MAAAMSEARTIIRLLREVRRRLRTNIWLQEGRDAAARALGVGVLLLGWNRTMPERLMLGWPFWALVGVGFAVHAVVRFGRREPLSQAAARVDASAGLHDELTSAYWFARHPEESEWVDLHVERAAERARSLNANTLVPLERPSLVLPLALAAVLAILTVAPVPRVFEAVVERLAAIDLSGTEEDLGTVAELQEAGAPEEPQAALQQGDEQQILVPQLEERGEGESLAPEEGALEEELEEPDPEGSFMEGDEEGEQGEAGEQAEGEPMDAENPDDVPADSEGEPSPDPNASEQDGEGESTEESGAMLPGGEEVFLQEGGEDLEQTEAGEEDLGHATREGGEEQELELGELNTLEVELQREILAVPEPEQEELTEEEKEEEITRAERSFLDFEAVNQPGEFARQELLESESIPWRYRRLVLTYFKALRERDNQQREEQQ